MPNKPSTSRPETPTQGEFQPPTPPSQISSFRPGAIPSDAEVFTTVLRDPWQVEDLLIRADSAPADGDFTFEVERAGSPQETVTLPQGETQVEASMDFPIDVDEGLRVRAQSTEDSGLEGVTCAFSLGVP